MSNVQSLASIMADYLSPIQKAATARKLTGVSGRKSFGEQLKIREKLFKC